MTQNYYSSPNTAALFLTLLSREYPESKDVDEEIWVGLVPATALVAHRVVDALLPELCF